MAAGGTYSAPFTVTGAEASVTGEECSRSPGRRSGGDTWAYTITVTRADAGIRVCTVTAGSATQDVMVTFTGIAGLATAGARAAGTPYRAAFTVWGAAATVTGAGCSLQAGPPPSPLGERSYTLTVTSAHPATLTCTVTGGGATEQVTVTFTKPAVTITGFEGTAGVSPIDAGFDVAPDDALCVAWRRLGIDVDSVQMTDHEGTERTVRVDTGSEVGDVEITVWCWSFGIAPARQTARFTVRPGCELPITPGGGTVSGTWTTACKSSQRGDDKTPYYARSFTFSLTAAARVVASVSSDQATSVYVLSDPHPDEDSPHASGITQASALLPVGDYKIEVARIKPRLSDGDFALTVSTDTMACDDGEERLHDGSCSPAGRSLYEFTKSAVVLTREAAIRALETRACASLTVDKLSALMLAPPVRELQRTSPSPMFLGRSDNLRQNPLNEWLYSRKTREDERRAHWHAGVGLWQLDIWPAARTFNHAERADVLKGGAGVAAYIRDRFCANSGNPLWNHKVFQAWYGCEDESNSDDKNRDLCARTYRSIYDEAGDSLWVAATEGSERDGGVQDRFCRWSEQRPAASDGGFACYLYDPASHEGNMDISRVEGTDSATNPNGFTPLAVAFVSLTDPDGAVHEGTKYAVFPRAHTGYAHTLIKAVPKDEYSRDSRLGPDGNGWYVGNVDGRVLYVREGANEECGASDAAAVAACEWIDPASKKLVM
ncbi:MAG: hypothetical protein OXC00_15150 [Acidimicrobiaceae bacterium]|nr:hypothetical protein [Acidimicrobiaceae bacterium]